MKIPHFNNPIVQKIIERFSRSRDFTISFILHFALIFIFGTAVLFKAVQEPADFEGADGNFVSQQANNTPPTPTQQTPTQQTFTVSTPQTSTPITAITTTSTTPLDFSISTVVAPDITKGVVKPSTTSATTSAPQTVAPGVTVAEAAAIRSFTEGWGKGNASGIGTGLKQREFEFTAYMGQYNGGNWSSTVRQEAGHPGLMGSLPNLLYYISKWSNGKIKTNEKNVKAIKLDSDEIFQIKPPFIFFTGTQDFKLSEREVENLRKYVQLGGAIWGDSSVPGLRSRFDIAFRREMKRVLPDKDKDFEPLPKDHPIYTKSYYPEIREIPTGLNYYQEPIYVLKIHGQIAVIYTANDYGDMWQTGVYEDPKTHKMALDTRLDENRRYIATNASIYNSSNAYLGQNALLHNVDINSLIPDYKFGVNVIIHLLTRWDDIVARAPKL